MSPSPLPPVVIGAGPAGIRAAVTLARHGLSPILLDEAPRPGGQIYRQPPAGPGQRSARELYGFEAAKATAIHQALAPYADRIDHRPETLVWNVERGALDLLSNGRTATLAYHSLILATGATDRVLPMPGWTLPGVFTLGGAQIALKAQGCGIGSTVVFLGTGPLLYLIAYQYAKAGATVAAVLDTSAFGLRIKHLPGLLALPKVLAKGLYYTAWLKARGVPVYTGITPVRAEGSERVASVVWQDSAGRQQQTACDGLGIGYGLRPETQLADMAGCAFSFNPLDRAWLPDRDTAGRSSLAGVYLAGDGAGITGADAAEVGGERAALALLQDQGATIDLSRVAVLEKRMAAFVRFRTALLQAFPLPAARWAETVTDDLVLCRCEEITAGDLRATVRKDQPHDLNRLKALSRIGMGRCQGRMCGAAAAELLAHQHGCAVSEIARIRPQTPIKPIPIGVTPENTP